MAATADSFGARARTWDVSAMGEKSKIFNPRKLFWILQRVRVRCGRVFVLCAEGTGGVGVVGDQREIPREGWTCNKTNEFVFVFFYC